MANELTVNGQNAVTTAATASLTRDQVDLLKRTICKGATDDEFALFQMVCNRTRLDPFSKQIHGVKRRSMNDETGRWEETLSFQVGIDGFRLISERTGKYEGQTAPQWCGNDGVWKDVWLANESPAAARVGVYKKGFREPIYGVATYSEYCQTKKDGQPVKMWGKMGPTMLAKCAEAQAHRKAFPQEMAGLYAPEEMEQAHTIPTQPDEAAAMTGPQWRTDAEMRAAFKEMYQKLGAEGFYAVILANGVEEPKDLKFDAKSRLIYSEMLADLRARENPVLEAEPCE